MLTYDLNDPAKYPSEPVTAVFVPEVKGAKTVSILVDTDTMIDYAIGNDARQVPVPPDKVYAVLEFGRRQMLRAMRELRSKGE